MATGHGQKPNILLMVADRHRADDLPSGRLVAESVNVTEMHRQSLQRLPVRASFLLERYVRDHGVARDDMALPHTEPTFLHALQDEGYHTAYIGDPQLWGVADRIERMHDYGFDEPIESVAGGAPELWIEEYEHDEPWFLWVDVPGWRGPQKTPGDAGGAMWAALENGNQLDSTWIISTTDGDDTSTRVPSLVRPPGGAPKATTVSTLTEHLDLPATIRAIAGATGRRHFEGRSLLPQIEGSDLAALRSVVFSEHDGFVMARTKHHKIVVHADSQTVAQLFDLAADPHEAHSLAAEAPELAEAMLAEHIRPFLEGGRATPRSVGGLLDSNAEPRSNSDDASEENHRHPGAGE